MLSRYCILTRTTYLLRVMPPASTAASAAVFDAFAARAFASFTEVLGFDGHGRAMIRLPLRFGGAGWTSMAEIADFAYVASLFAAIDGFCDVSPQWRQVALDLARSVDGAVGGDRSGGRACGSAGGCDGRGRVEASLLAHPDWAHKAARAGLRAA